MSEQQPEQEVEQVWQYQVRDKNGIVVGDWSTPAEAEFKWPKAERGQTRWVKKGQRWSKVK